MRGDPVFPALRAAHWAALAVFAALAAVACGEERAGGEPDWAAKRAKLVAERIATDIEDEAVLAAMRKVPRHLFVPEKHRSLAYEDRPLPIGEGQTISQPYVVAIMTHLLELGPGAKVLEIGTGSGYQAAVLAEIGADVYTIEILPAVAKIGADNLRAAGYDGIHLRVGDGYLGWPDAAPFDGIIVTCAPDHVPQPLQEQLAEGGRLVIPVGERGRVQSLVLIEKRKGRLEQREVIPVRFVPMTGPGVESASGAPR